MALREFKVVVIGAGAVGAKELTVQYVQNIFAGKYDATFEDSYRKQIEVDGEQCIIEILNVAGTEQFTAMRDLYIKKGQGFILIYSITAQSTFNDIPGLKEQILRIKDCDNVPLVVVGNKCDLVEQRVISTAQGEELALKLGGAFFETSAKDRTNVDEMFNEIINQINIKFPPSLPKEEKQSAGGCSLS